MDFDSYTFEARKTAIYPRDKAEEYLALGLASEAGEWAGKVKKAIRDGSSIDPLLECGDMLWYITMTLDEYGYSLQECAEKNIEKLRDRQERGQLQGSGDGR